PSRSAAAEEGVKRHKAVKQSDGEGFLRPRLKSNDSEAPLDGIARGGYRLVYTDAPSDFVKKREARRKLTDLSFSLGFIVGRENRLADVQWGGPAYAAGLTVGTQIIAVDGIAYDSDRLRDVVKAGKTSHAAVELLVKNGDRYSTVRIDYHDGLRYPHLERDASVPARLDQILEPRK